MVPAGGNITHTMLTNKKAILKQYGEILFREELEEERVSRVKKIILAYDMDAAENFWEKKFGNPHKRSVRVRVPIQSTTGGTFSLAEYGEVSRASTKWMQQRSEGALRYMRSASRCSPGASRL